MKKKLRYNPIVKIELLSVDCHERMHTFDLDRPFGQPRPSATCTVLAHRRDGSTNGRYIVVTLERGRQARREGTLAR